MTTGTRNLLIVLCLGLAALIVAAVGIGVYLDHEAGKTRKAPKPDLGPKALAYIGRVSDFLEEARVGAKLLTMGPSQVEMTAKAHKITELYSRIPDAPPEVDPTGVLTKKPSGH